MSKNVLIVDDDQELLLLLKESLENYEEIFSVILAGDGQAAVEKLKENPVSLVVTDLYMPRMDGLNLLAYIMENYPEMPVIIITGYGTPKLEALAREGGAVEYIEKPFMTDDLARQIITLLRRESEGGNLTGVSSATFMQLMELEQKTCTMRVYEKWSGKEGVLFFRDGQLLDARSNGLQGEPAALQILSWEEANISIQNTCSLNEKRIDRDLRAILLDAVRLKDESGEENEPVVDEESRKEIKKVMGQGGDEDSDSLLEGLRKRLEAGLGKSSGLEDIYFDNSWDNLISQLDRIGRYLGTGDMHACYLDKGQTNDLILLPGKKTIVISVSPRCPRDKMLDVLRG